MSQADKTQNSRFKRNTKVYLLLDPCLITTGIGEQDLQHILHTTFSEDEWANEVLREPRLHKTRLRSFARPCPLSVVSCAAFRERED